MTEAHLYTLSRSRVWKSTEAVCPHWHLLLAAAGEDNTEFTYWTEDQQNAFWDAVNDGGAAFAQEIVDYCVENGVSEEGDVAGAAAQWGFDGLAADATAKDFFMAIGDKYGWSFTAMEAESAGKRSLRSDSGRRICIRYRGC